jgi:N6-adenosine-specific RNA methylase IME4
MQIDPKFPMGKYKTIVVDPPWKYGKWGAGSKKCVRFGKECNTDIPMPYETMSIKDIKRLEIKSIADKNTELFLWTTNKYLPSSFDVIRAWGFKYCDTLAWCKTPRGTGQGGLFTPTMEFIVHGRVGKMPKKQRIETTWWQARRQKKHSRKPEFFQDIIESVTDAPRIELFARRKRKGWDAWGNEV